MFKSIVFHERLPKLSRAQFMHHWLKVHTPMSHGTKNLYGYVCHELVGDATPEGAARLNIGGSVDGIAQMWFATPDGIVTLPDNQPHVKEWFADGPNFIGRRMRYMGEEAVLAPPQRLDFRTPKIVMLAATGSNNRVTFEKLQASLRALPAERMALGLALTRVLSGHATASIGGFPMSDFHYVLETWLPDQRASQEATAALIDAARPHATAFHAFLTHEYVIQTPVAAD